MTRPRELFQSLLVLVLGESHSPASDDDIIYAVALRFILLD